MNAPDERVSSPTPKPGPNKLMGSRVAKGLLLMLGLLYSLACIAAFFAASQAGDNPTARSTRSVLIRHGVQHMLIGALCISAFVLVLRGSKLANAAAGIAAGSTGLVAIKALVSSMFTGFYLYNLIEPVVVLPSVAFIVWRLVLPDTGDRSTNSDIPEQ